MKEVFSKDKVDYHRDPCVQVNARVGKEKNQENACFTLGDLAAWNIPSKPIN